MKIMKKKEYLVPYSVYGIIVDSLSSYAASNLDKDLFVNRLRLGGDWGQGVLPSGPIEWGSFCHLIDVAVDVLGGEYMEHCASCAVKAGRYSILKSFAGLMTGPFGMYKIINDYLGPSNLPLVRGEISRISEYLARVDITVENPWYPHRGFFEFNGIMLSWMLCVIGYGKSSVECEYINSGCYYLIRLPPSRSIFSRLRNSLYALWNGNEAVVDRLTVQFEEIKNQNDDLQDANKKLLFSERNTRALQSLYFRSMAGSSDGIWSVVDGSDVIDVNSAWSELTGISEHNGKASFCEWVNSVKRGSRVHGDYNFDGSMNEWHADFVYSPRLSSECSCYLRVKGSLVYDDYMQRECFAGVVSDITSQKLAEQDLAQIINHIPEGVIVLSVNGDVVAYNAKSLSLLGVGAELRFPEYLVDAVLPSALSGEGEVMHSRFEYDSGIVFVPKAINLPSGQSFMFVCYSVEEKMADQARLVQTDRLVSMGTMTATIGHEINNPLAYMRTNMDLLQDSIDELKEDLPSKLELAMEDAQESVHAVIEGIKTVATIVDDLRSFSRLRETQELVAVPPEKIAESAANMIMTELRKLDAFDISIETQRWACVDESRVMQVLTNFLTNAALAVEDEERKEVVLRVKDAEPGYVVFSVEDTGCGIPPDKLESVFEPFYTKRASGKGTGLGLYICKSLIESMGGTIWVESELGVGTTFFAKVGDADPDVSEEVSLIEEIGAEDLARVAREASIKLLCVEEDDDLRASLTRSYAKLFDVTCVPSARAAMALLEVHVPFDAVLCSLRLNKDSGLLLHDTIMEQFGSEAPRFLFSIEDLTNEEIRALGSRSPTALSKPVRREVLLHRVLVLKGRADELSSGSTTASKPSGELSSKPSAAPKPG